MTRIETWYSSMPWRFRFKLVPCAYQTLEKLQVAFIQGKQNSAGIQQRMGHLELDHQIRQKDL